MKGIEIFLGLSQVEETYIDEAEFGVFTPEKGEVPKSAKVLHLRKTLLIAAVIALMLVLAGCAVAYVMHMQDLHMGQQENWADSFDEDLNYLGRETFTEQVFTLSGLKGSPAYQGALAWFDFAQSYDTDGAIQEAAWSDPPKFPEQYDAYNIYSQEMADKLDEIAEEYGLSLLGAKVKGQSPKSLFRYFGVDDLLSQGSAAQMQGFNGWGYECGGLYMELFLNLPPETGWPYQTLCVYRLNPKDALCTDSFTQIDSENWREWNYTTAAGDKVLILSGESSQIAWILCDRDDAMVSLRVDSVHSVGSDEGGRQHFEDTHMTDKQLEQVADAMNWKLNLKSGDPALLDGAAGDPGETVQIQNGVAVSLKKVETDGITAYITLGITAPEGMKLPHTTDSDLGILNFVTWNFDPEVSREWMRGENTTYVQDDGDGKDNTVDYIICANVKAKDSKDAFIPGETWKLYLEDIHIQDWNPQISGWDNLWETEGAWAFDIPISEDNDFREVEFVSQPITTSTAVGMTMDGDVFGDVTLSSLKVRTYSTDVSATGPYEGAGIDFYDAQSDKFPYLYLKDGTKIKLWLSSGAHDLIYHETIPLDEIDYLLLADGTKLTPVP